jgi:hypothetical protein
MQTRRTLQLNRLLLCQMHSRELPLHHLPLRRLFLAAVAVGCKNIAARYAAPREGAVKKVGAAFHSGLTKALR